MVFVMVSELVLHLAIQMDEQKAPWMEPQLVHWVPHLEVTWAEWASRWGREWVPREQYLVLPWDVWVAMKDLWLVLCSGSQMEKRSVREKELRKARAEATLSEMTSDPLDM